MASKRRNSLKTGTLIKILIGVILLIIVVAVGIRILRSRVDDQFASEQENSVESAEVTTGSISTTVSGSGTLAYEDSEDLTLPSSVEITNYYVSKGDDVEEGDLLASVNSATLVSAMGEIQSQMDDLDEEIAEVSEETVSDELDTAVDGRVKKIYAEEDEDVASVMYDHEALLLLSLDGEMALDVSTDALKTGDSVTVEIGDSSYDGTVEDVVDGSATITLTDNGPSYDADAEVFLDGTSIGTGTLYIHESLAVTGYAGTIDSIEVSENEKVDAGDTLFTLSDTSSSANYHSLLSERQDLEDQLQDLMTIYKEGAVYAKETGTLVSLTKGSDGSSSSASADSTSEDTAGTMSGFSMTAAAGTGASADSSSSDTAETDTVFSISPNTNMNLTVSIDESDILSVSVDQEATVSVDSLEDQTFTGTVTEIDTDGSSSNGVTSYSVVISVPKDEQMLSGMSASATIQIEGVEDALLIPEDALNKTSSTAYVYTSYDEETDTLGDMVEVTIGISNGEYVEIKEGLSEGDTVYYKTSDSDETFDFGSMGGFGGQDGFSGGMPDMNSFQGGDSMPGGGMNMPGGK